MIVINGQEVMQWGDVEGGVRTEIGYSRKECDRLWMLVTFPGYEAWLEGYRTASLAWPNGDPKPFWLCDGLDDSTLIFLGHREAISFLYTARQLPWSREALLLNVGDYWRVGDVPPRKPKYAESRKTLDKIAQRAWAAGERV